MISHVISACYVTWQVCDQPREQCMFSHVFSADKYFGLKIDDAEEKVKLYPKSEDELLMAAQTVAEYKSVKE